MAKWRCNYEVTLFCREFHYWRICAFVVLILGVQKCACAIFYAICMSAWDSYDEMFDTDVWNVWHRLLPLPLSRPLRLYFTILIWSQSGGGLKWSVRTKSNTKSVNSRVWIDQSDRTPPTSQQVQKVWIRLQWTLWMWAQPRWPLAPRFPKITIWVYTEQAAVAEISWPCCDTYHYYPYSVVLFNALWIANYKSGKVNADGDFCKVKHLS